MRLWTGSWRARVVRGRHAIERRALVAVAIAAQVEHVEKGQIDADLGGGVIKQRIARPGEGRSKGYRSIIVFRKGKRAFFVYGFPKSAIGNIAADDEAQFKKMAGYVLALTDLQLRQLIVNGQFEEISEDGQKISQRPPCRRP